jgi:hypothetical protein
MHWVGRSLCSLLGVATVVVCSACGVNRPPPPLLPPETQIINGSIAHTGRPFAYGHPVLYNTGQDALEIVSARMLGGPPSDSVEVGEARSLSGDRGIHSVLTLRRWPPKQRWSDRTFLPAASTAVQPKDDSAVGQYGVELFFPMTVHKPGNYKWDGLEVIYNYKGSQYTYQDNDIFALCSPPPIDKGCLEEQGLN